MIEQLKQKISQVKSRREFLESIIRESEGKEQLATIENINKIKVLVNQQTEIIGKFEALLKDIECIEA
jgi:hypothetical protein